MPMFMVALFTIARAWKQPRCPLTDEWTRKLWYIYTMEYYSAIKKNAFESVVMRRMKLQPIIQSEVSQKATVRTGHGTTDWFQTGKGVCQGYILSPCLFNLYAEYIM